MKPNESVYWLLGKAIAYGITVGARFLYNRRSLTAPTCAITHFTLHSQKVPKGQCLFL
ncbi:MAG: hypothetical protein F6K47_13590 [Symploca sp. SIO2E6]|nr:hypothetical protein [Symploca sp. SIO2E6]